MNNEFEEINNTAENEAVPEPSDTSPEIEEAPSGIEEIPSEETAEDNYSCISFNFEKRDDSFSGEVSDSDEVKAVKKNKGKVLKIIALSLVCGLLFGATFGIANGLIRKYAMSKIAIETTEARLKKADRTGLPESDIAVISEACMPSIVAITNRGVADVETFFGSYAQESTSSGSGIIIARNDTELLIVTNYHVVANSKELSVVFSPVEMTLERNGEIEERYIPSAVVKGYDIVKDLAVIAVNLDDIPEEIFKGIAIATIGDSSIMKPGDRVIAIGNSLGYGQSVTSGVISAVNRKITMQVAGSGNVTNSYIQTDAAINQGNSGGALLDMNGNVIGINSVKIATTGVEGMGYAIPISDVESIITELMNQRTRTRASEDKQGYLGITGSDVSQEISTTYGIPMGVYVNAVDPGLAAEKGGIRAGHIIVEFDGYTITSILQLQERLLYYEKGETVKVKVKVPGSDGYTDKELTVTLSHRSDAEED